MLNPWQNLNPAIPLGKPLTIAPPHEAQARLERETPRPVMGMLPRALKVRADGLAREYTTYPLTGDPHRAAPPVRSASDSFQSELATEPSKQGAPVPRVVIENYPRCASQPIQTAKKPDPAIGRSRIEALNGRLIVRSRVELGRHSCILDQTGTHEIEIELLRQGLSRDLMVLESSVRGVAAEGMLSLSPVGLHIAEAKPVHAPVALIRPRQQPRLVGPRLRIPLPRIEQA